jgi:hypothetical protein
LIICHLVVVFIRKVQTWYLCRKYRGIKAEEVLLNN